MKRILALILILAALLCACGSEKPQETTTAPTIETTDPTPVVDWITLPADRTLAAAQYFVYDCDAKQFVIKAEDISTKIYPASHETLHRLCCIAIPGCFQVRHRRRSAEQSSCRLFRSRNQKG